MQILKKQIERYLQQCREVRRLSTHTVSAYENDLFQFCAVLPKSECITSAMIREGLTKIAENPRYAPATIKRKIAAVRTFIRALDAKLALEAFGDWRLKIKTPARLPKAVSRRELRLLLTSAKPAMPNTALWDDCTHLCLSLLAATGLRVSELCALRNCDVRPDTGEIGHGTERSSRMQANCW